MCRTHRDDEYIQFVAKTSYDMAGRDQLATAEAFAATLQDDVAKK